MDQLTKICRASDAGLPKRETLLGNVSENTTRERTRSGSLNFSPQESVSAAKVPKMSKGSSVLCRAASKEGCVRKSDWFPRLANMACYDVYYCYASQPGDTPNLAAA